MTDQNQGQGDTGAGDGEQTSFLDGIQNEELRGNEGLSSFDSLDSLAEDYVKIRASQPAKAPDTIEGYEFEMPEEMRFDEEKNPDGIKINAEDDQKFKEFILEKGWSPDQYKDFMGYQSDKIAENRASQTEQINKQGEEAITRRKAEYGAGYEVAVDNSFKALTAFGEEGMKDDPIVNDDRIFGMLAKIGGAISEGKLNAGGDGFNNKPKVGEDGKLMLSFPSMEKQ